VQVQVLFPALLTAQGFTSIRRESLLRFLGSSRWQIGGSEGNAWELHGMSLSPSCQPDISARWFRNVDLRPLAPREAADDRYFTRQRGGGSIPVSNFMIVDEIPQQPPIALVKLRYQSPRLAFCYPSIAKRLLAAPAFRRRRVFVSDTSGSTRRGRSGHLVRILDRSPRRTFYL
jgi:hypothetical protein